MAQQGRHRAGETEGAQQGGEGTGTGLRCFLRVPSGSRQALAVSVRAEGERAAWRPQGGRAGVSEVQAVQAHVGGVSPLLHGSGLSPHRRQQPGAEGHGAGPWDGSD